MNLGLALIRGQTVPPYNYVTHRLVTRKLLLAEAEANK
jgi:ribose transport system substrate-binding protein